MTGLTDQTGASATGYQGAENRRDTSIATLGMWFFLASEGMFFIAMLGAFVVLGSTGQQRELFEKSSRVLSGWVVLCSVVLLMLCSAGIARQRRSLQWMVIASAVLFLIFQAGQWILLFNRHTIVFRDSENVFVADGSTLLNGPQYLTNAARIPLPPNFDIHATTSTDFIGGTSKSGQVYIGEPVLQDLNYGSSRNNYFSSYFLMSAMHGLHIFAGLIPLIWVLLFRAANPSTALQNYWHFINFVGIVGLLALYFV